MDATAAAASGDVVAFELTSATVIAPENGISEHHQDVKAGDEDATRDVCGGGDSVLICDTNNNELIDNKIEECGGMIIATPPSMEEEKKDVIEDMSSHQLLTDSMPEQCTKDQSIDSGVAGGDSDEADCCNGVMTNTLTSPPPKVIVPEAEKPTEIPVLVPSRPPSTMGSGSTSNSSGSCSFIASGEDEIDHYPLSHLHNHQFTKERASPLMMSPAEHSFFMNGIDKALSDEEDEDQVQGNSCGSLRGIGGERGNNLSEENSSLLLLQHGGKNFDQDCKICQNPLKSPRVLSCLHIYCESCLDNQLLISNDMCLNCPVCHQRTSVGRNGAASLHLDYVQTNILDLSSIDLSVLACTSCKSKDVAISRCNDCANILCASCDNAHQYMRCFETHTVVRLQELLERSADTVAIHKPLFCTVHATENLKYYCQHCQVPVCNECLIGEHKGGEHSYEVIAEAEISARMELERMQRDSQMQVDHCNEAQMDLDNALTELQSQHDSARATIEESYQSFKAVLEKCRDNSLKQLDLLHSERELKVMEVMHDVEKCTEKIECAGKFTDRVLCACNGPELLSLKALIARQFNQLGQQIPRTNINYSIEFESQFEVFQRLAQETFGRFQTEVSAPSPKESTPPPTLPGMPPILISHLRHNASGHQQGHPMGHNSHMTHNMHSGGLHNNNMSHGPPHHGPPPSHLHLQVQLNNGTRPLMGLGGLSSSSSSAVSSNNSNSLMGISAFNGTATSQNGNALSNSVTASSPISLPPSMQSSFDGDMSSSGISNQAPSSASTSGSMPSFGSLMNDHHNNHSHHNNHRDSNNVGGAPIIPPMNIPPPSLVGNNMNSNGSSVVVPPVNNGLTSIAEYNIQQLANLVEQSSSVSSSVVGDMTDVVSVPPPNVSGPQGAITLNDILSIDPHALQAWSKMGGLNQHASALLSRGPSPSVDNLLLNDYSSIAPNSDDMMLTNFNGNGGAAVTVSNNGGIGGGSGGSQSSSGIGVPGRTKSTAMQIRCKFGSLGPSKGQFNSPHGFCLGVDEEIVVADTNNHRIEVFEKSGTFKFQFGVPGKDEGQLWYPRKVAVMRPSSKFVVCDRGNERSRMQIFNKAGHFMKKIAIRYIDIVAGLAVTNQGHIVAVDSVSPTVFIISEEGDLVHWFDCSDYMREPSDIAINGNDFYVCDFKGHCVAVFSDDGTFKYRIGNEKITCFPNGIDISDAGDILIGDSHGNRFHVACFSRDGVLQSEYECPYVKVSRCCGLKITSEGFVVTLAKNNHHVLVLNTLYIQ